MRVTAVSLHGHRRHTQMANGVADSNAKQILGTIKSWRRRNTREGASGKSMWNYQNDVQHSAREVELV